MRGKLLLCPARSMKILSVVIAVAVLACAGGVWFGRLTAPTYPMRLGGYVCSVSCGDGNYPKEAFETVNNEIPARINALLGEYQDSKHLVVVTPMTSGYKVEMAGSGSSKLWDSAIQYSLLDWISERMDAIQLEAPNEAEKAGAKIPATRSQSDSQGSDRPQPESEGRSR